MHAHDLIKKQHRAVEAAYEEFQAATDDDRKEDLAKRILTDLTVHATIEEEIYYKALEEAGEEEMVKEFKKDHNEAKLLIGKLTIMDEDWKGFDESMDKLMSAILAHVAVEEDEEMPKVEEILSAEALEDLGTRMEERWDELQESTLKRVWAALKPS
jgi:hemerythrin superfamily protein